MASYTGYAFGQSGSETSAGTYPIRLRNHEVGAKDMQLAANEFPTQIKLVRYNEDDAYYHRPSGGDDYSTFALYLCDYDNTSTRTAAICNGGLWDGGSTTRVNVSGTLSGNWTSLRGKCLAIKFECSKGQIRNAVEVQVTTNTIYTAAMVQATGGSARFTDFPNNTSVEAAGGASFKVTATPNSGYQFSRWKIVTGNQTTYGTGDSITMPYGETTITPEFTKISYAITKTTMTNGSVTIVTTAQMGDTVKYSSSANTGYKLSNITIKRADNNTAVVNSSSASGSFTMPASALTVSATFVKADYAVAATANPAEGGTTTVKNSSGTVITTSQYQNKVTFSQKTNEGYRFDGWTGYTTVSSSEFTIDMPNQAVSYTANYTAHTLTWSSNPSLAVMQRDEILTFTLNGTVTDNFGNEFDILLYKGKSGDIGASTGVKFNKNVATYTLTDAETEKDILFTARAVNTSGHILAVNGPQITLRPTALHRTVHYYDGAGYIECVPYVCTEINSGIATWTEVEPMTYTEDGWIACSGT